MRKPQTRFEQVPVEVAEKILQQENLLTKRSPVLKRVVRKLGRAPSRPHAPSKGSEISTL